MSLDEIREKGHGSVDAAKEAFDELCAMVEALNVGFSLNINQNIMLTKFSALKFTLKELTIVYIKFISIQAEREERREVAIARFQARRAYNARIREKNQKLRAQYLALLES